MCDTLHEQTKTAQFLSIPILRYETTSHSNNAMILKYVLERVPLPHLMEDPLNPLLVLMDEQLLFLQRPALEVSLQLHPEHFHGNARWSLKELMFTSPVWLGQARPKCFQGFCEFSEKLLSDMWAAHVHTLVRMLFRQDH